ncbi:ABC transporter ATP-binding protein [Erythrobacter sp. GH1-10]|uniref:ABC transporter ATP-binding protein n=1 Tax=Erythrobacter sp. GH1-10 TaxID=3349334 RepID=UPI0038782CD1
MTLSVRNLTLERGGTPVIEGLSTTLEAGTITAIVGPNGAGKSSLLLGLAGLLDPAAGTVLLDHGSLRDLGPRARAKALGYLPQSAEIAWDVAVEALVALGRLPHRDRGREEIEAAIAALSLEDLRHRPASRLSGGERARVLLARVLAGTPRWILADEPLAALDLAHQLALVAHLKGCAATGQGVVIVLHDLALAMNHADRVLVLNEGRLIADGSPEEALNRDVISRGWGVASQWIGDPGARAVVVGEAG